MNKWGQVGISVRRIPEFKPLRQHKMAGLEWVLLAQGMAKWRPFINTGTNIRFA